MKKPCDKRELYQLGEQAEPQPFLASRALTKSEIVALRQKKKRIAEELRAKVVSRVPELAKLST